MSLAGDISGPHTARQLPDPRGPHEGDTLLVVAKGVTRLDAYSSVVIRGAIEQHLALNSEAEVCPWLPADPDTYARFNGLLAPFPSRCRFETDPDPLGRDPRILIPATSVEDLDRAHLAIRYLLEIAPSPHQGNLRVSRAQVNLVATAGIVFLDNALRYADDSDCAPFISCAIDSDTRDIQLAVLDLGCSVSHEPTALSQLRESLKRSRDDFGGLSGLADLSDRCEVPVSLELRTGTAYAKWNGSWSSREVAFSPGWLAGITVHRSQAG